MNCALDNLSLKERADLVLKRIRNIIYYRLEVEPKDPTRRRCQYLHVLREIRKRENEDPEEEYTKQNLYEDEYQVFCLRDYEQPDDYQFRIESTDVSDTLSDYIEDVIMVKRLIDNT